MVTKCNPLGLIDSMNENDPKYLKALVDEYEHRLQAKIYSIFPEEGPLRRELYPSHMKFLAAGKDTKIRVLEAGNRTGKTQAANVEIAYHATGLYPDWWEGVRYEKPPIIWCVQESYDKTHEIFENYLFGTDDEQGLIPDYLVPEDKITKKQGA